MLSLPHRLRYLLAWDHDLCRTVAGVLARAVFRHLRDRARDAGIRDGRGGGVVVIQRFGGALNLNLHFHALVLDGVFAPGEAGALQFQAIDELTTLEGRVRVSLREPWRDGTTDFVFDPVDFLGRLAVLVPRPRVNLVLCYGILGPRAGRRDEMVRRASAESSYAEKCASDTMAVNADREAADGREGRGWRWAALMRRIFGFDVLACPRCGGRLRLIALIEDAAVIGRIVRHLGQPDTIPSPRAARPPPANTTDEFTLA